jgi:hypothetical protein
VGVSRRAVLSAGLGVPVVAAGCTPRKSTPGAQPQASAYREGTEPVAMAMHLHGSFSEGRASMATHLDQAERLGVDVLFFSDHDFRVAALGYPTDLSFGDKATWKRRDAGKLRAGDATFAGSTVTLAATGDTPEGGTVWLDAQAWNFTYRTSLADTTLTLTALPQAAGPDAYLQLELDLSHHPAAAGRPAGQPRLAYHVGPFPARRRRVDGLAGVVEVPAPVGRRSTLALRPVEDAAALWPDLVAEDNALFRLRVGVAARRGATARYTVDLLRIDRDERDGQRSLDLFRRVLTRAAQRHPDRRAYPALEVSLVRHLNWYGGDLAIPDYNGVATPPYINSAAPAAAAMVGRLRARGGLVSYNHPLYGDRGAVARHMVDTRALGADIVEIAFSGVSNVDSMLHVFDAMARNLVFATGNGVTDDHNGTDWYANPKSNWITRAWAGSTDLPDLLAALAAGRVWCYKPDGWRGALEVRVAGRPAMGGVLVTGDRAVPLAVTATELPKGGALEVVTGRADSAAPEPATTSVAVPAGGYEHDAAPGTYVRAMVRDAKGAIVGVGNPVWLLPAGSAATIPPQRRL